MVYMLVIVTAYPRRALELIKYQQIISRAVTKFKGLAWLSYDQQFPGADPRFQKGGWMADHIY